MQQLFKMTHLNFTLSPCGHQSTLEITCLPHTRVKYYIKPREGAEPQAREGNMKLHLDLFPYDHASRLKVGLSEYQLLFLFRCYHSCLQCRLLGWVDGTQAGGKGDSLNLTFSLQTCL